jgi:hypothetical protein
VVAVDLAVGVVADSAGAVADLEVAVAVAADSAAVVVIARPRGRQSR